MTNSTRKKKEKTKDHVKPKLKVGAARPKNTNATDTTFAAKSIVLRQQNLDAHGSADTAARFEHQLSLLGAKNETQRKEALGWLVAACADGGSMPRSVGFVVGRVQALVLDGSEGVRGLVLKLLKVLPRGEMGGAWESLLLYARAGMAHLSAGIRRDALRVLEWMVGVDGERVVGCAGGWVKVLRTFQGVLGWKGAGEGEGGNWSNARAGRAGGSKLFVQQLSVLALFLTAGLSRPSFEFERAAAAERASAYFPLRHTDAHILPGKSNPYGYLNVFGAPRDLESEVYEDPEERAEVFCELGFDEIIGQGVMEAKKEGGELGRAAAAVAKALRLVEMG